MYGNGCDGIYGRSMVVCGGFEMKVPPFYVSYLVFAKFIFGDGLSSQIQEW